MDGWMDDGWGNTLGLETKMEMLALMQPSEPKTFPSSMFGAGDALPEGHTKRKDWNLHFYPGQQGCRGWV